MTVTGAVRHVGPQQLNANRTSEYPFNDDKGTMRKSPAANRDAADFPARLEKGK
jgi:hypothetical protein